MPLSRPSILHELIFLSPLTIRPVHVVADCIANVSKVPNVTLKPRVLLPQYKNERNSIT